MRTILPELPVEIGCDSLVRMRSNKSKVLASKE